MNHAGDKYRKLRMIRSLLIMAVAGLSWLQAAGADGPEPADALVLEFAQAQTAVLDPVQWDKVLPNELYFDAVRPMLVRFPDAAEALHAKLADGYEIEKLELVLQWKAQEGPNPERGRSGWGAEELYKNNPGAWHVVVHALRHPWSTGVGELGPTFNAAINGLLFWDRSGARGDGTDRSTWVAGPAPLYAPVKKAPPPPQVPGEKPQDDLLADLFPQALEPPLVARLDVTQVLADPAFGKTLGERLRAVEEEGFEVYKLEIRDMKYRSFWAYDWAVSIGYLKIWVEKPRLVATFRQAAAVVPAEPLPPATDIRALAEALKAKGGEGKPGIYVPADLAQRAERHLQRPDGIPDWQWKRILELRALGTDPKDVVLYLGRGYNFHTLFANDSDAYLASMRELLRLPPRTWLGHQTSDFAILAAGYADLLPPAVIDHLTLYWTAWLHPDVEHRDDIGGGQQRGGPSYFRGYSHGGGTMNFGHNAVMGALLGGQFLNSEFVLADAREGLANLVRNWGLGSGASQEIGDTYYQALSLNSPGAIAKFARDPVDRLEARFQRDRLLEPLISMYHPGLRRMTHPMGRGNYTYHILLQEGPYHILHSLSPSGALMHLDDLTPDRRGTPASWGKIHGLSILGDESPPYRMGLLAPWTEPYLAETMGALVDNKPLPVRIFARDFSPGCRGGGWHVNYLGRSYALASRDNANHDYGITSVVAQWRRKSEPVSRVDDLSTLIMSFERNGRFPAPGVNMAEFGIVQADNKLVALKALPRRDVLEEKKTPIVALQSCIAIIALGDVALREVWINDRKSDALSGARPDPGGDWIQRMSKGLRYVATETAPKAPGEAEPEILIPGDDTPRGRVVNDSGTNRVVVEAQDGDRIAIRDGVTYIGLIPLTLNPLERNRQVEIAFEYPTLFVNAFLVRGDQPVDLDRVYNATNKPTAGFVVELGDATEYPSFEAFRKHLKDAQLSATWNAEKKMADVDYVSGPDHLEMGFDPAAYPAKVRRVNGKWPYLPEGIMRESSWAIQGSTGRLEKNGAVLESEPGHQTYLLAAPATDTYIAYNSLPEPIAWSFSVPGGMTIQAKDKLSLARVVVRPKENRIWVDHAVRPAQAAQDQGSALLVFGTSKAPTVMLNDVPYSGPLVEEQIDGKTAYVISWGQKP